MGDRSSKRAQRRTRGRLWGQIRRLCAGQRSTVTVEYPALRCITPDEPMLLAAGQEFELLIADRITMVAQAYSIPRHLLEPVAAEARNYSSTRAGGTTHAL